MIKKQVSLHLKIFVAVWRHEVDPVTFFGPVKKSKMPIYLFF